MMKKWIALLLALVMAFCMTACAAEPEPAPAPAPEPIPEPAPEPKPEPAKEVSNLVGVSMPTKELQRWKNDGDNMKNQLEKAGYEVDLQYAQNDASMQISQIEKMIADGAKVLVISAIDGEALGTVLAEAKAAGVSVIAYDRLIMGSDAVTYYVTFGNYDVGVKQAQYIVDALDLDNAPEGATYNIEFVFGDPGDGNIYFFIDSAISVLQPYLDSGVLVVQSGQTEPFDAATEGWSAVNAQKRFEELLPAYYTNKPLHAVLASNDSTAQGIASALATSYSNDIYPVITGQNCDILSVQNILDGKQAMSVFKDTRDLAAKAAEMAEAIMKGKKPDINDRETYDNGTGFIPSYLCEPRVCTRDNYKELLINSGYYTEEELEEYSNRNQTSITIPDGVTTIKASEFSGRTNLTSITIPDSVTTIEDRAFYGCAGLTSIIIPDSVTAIGKSAFESCYKLTNVTIPDSVRTIGESAFSDCSSLTGVTIPGSVRTIGKSAFSKCSSLTSVTILDGAAAIGEYAFSSCGSLTSITIPGSVETIGAYAFAGCVNLTSITLEDGVRTIGAGAFEECSRLTSITIPGSVTTIGYRAFSGCDMLEAIWVAEGNPSYCSDENGVLFNKSKTDLIAYPGALRADYTIPDGVRTIGKNAFSDCRNLTKVTIPDSVTMIGESAFSGCSSLTTVTIPDSVKIICDDAFYFCTSLTSVAIPDSVTAISDGTFFHCSNLTNVTIPDSVTAIGHYAFDSCYELTNITIPDGVTTIGRWTFQYCRSLISVTIPSSITSIELSAFASCTSLRSITIPDSVTRIVRNVFEGCESLTDIYYGGSQEQWGQIDKGDNDYHGISIHYNAAMSNR